MTRLPPQSYFLNKRMKTASSPSCDAENIHKPYVFASRAKYFKTVFKAYRFKAWDRNKFNQKFII